MTTYRKTGPRLSPAKQLYWAVAFALIFGTAVAGCAQHDRDDQESRSGGFYGGLTGGTTR
jgi:hypothetical protein